MRAHDRAALRRQRWTNPTAEQYEAERADINRLCIFCNYEIASHCPASVISSRKTFLHCPEHLPER